MQLFDFAHPQRSHELQAAVLDMSDTSGTDRGAVFTQPTVVEAILDLVGYTPDRDLVSLRLLEPSFGGGDFLLPAVDRLLSSWARQGSGDPVAELATSIVAVEVHRETFNSTRKRLVAHLQDAGVPNRSAEGLASAWLRFDDFLLADLPTDFDVIVGNPPYVRQERIPEVLLAEYRRRYSTIFDRADLYVPFFERGLHLLGENGRLGFICANRWVKNKYGGPLRKVVADGPYHLQCYIDMEGTPAFTSDVIAYPAITVIQRGATGGTRIARRPEITQKGIRTLARAMATGAPDSRVEVVHDVARGTDPWLLDSAGQLRLVRRLEAEFPLVEDDGCRIGIGVASGADAVFIGPYKDLPVECARKLPLVMARDIRGGVVEWGGRGIVNPWLPDGNLAPLESFPAFATYVQKHEDVLRRRHTAKGSPAKWYKTIDRIYEALTHAPKLLIPDIKGDANVVYDDGSYYPHHNLYYVVSDRWQLRALQTVLRASVSMMFISAYSVRMSGGFLRFQAQYLRRMRIPRWSEIPRAIRDQLAAMAETKDIRAIDDVVSPLYQLSAEEDRLVRELAHNARVRGASNDD